MRWLFICLAISPLGVFAQSDMVKIDSKIGCSCSALDDANLHLAEKAVASNQLPDTLAVCYLHCIGLRYHINSAYPNAIENHKKALALRGQVQPDFLWKSHYMLGMAYDRLGMCHQSVSSLQNAAYTKGIKRTKDSIEIFRIMAENLSRIGELKKAEEYAIRATQIDGSDKHKVKAYNTLVIILGREEQSDENKERAVEFADIAIQLAGTNKEIIAQVTNNKANALSWLGRYDEAIDAYDSTLNLYNKNTENYARVLGNKGSDLSKKGNYLKAKEAILQSLKIKQDLYKETYAHIYAANQENIAENYERLGDINKALEYYQLALINLTDNFRNKDPKTNPSVSAHHYIYNKPDLIRVLDLKAQAALKNDNINLAYETYEELDNWITEFYKDLNTNEARLIWIDRAHAIYGNAIKAASLKNDQEKAFQYAEKAHAVLLWKSLSQQAAQSLLSEEERQEINDLTIKIRQADQQYRNGEIPIDVLRTHKRELEVLEEKFDKKHPEYVQRKYQSEAITFNHIQSKIIDKHTAFIEYYLTDEILYIFTITKNGLEVTQKNAAGLAHDITDFVENIRRENMNMEDCHALAYHLYQRLLPESIRSNDQIKHLVIVPDSEIGMLPFAALVTQSISSNLDNNTPFLLKKYTTNYLYSAGSYLQLQQRKADQAYCFAGIAPVEYPEGDWLKLKYAGQELDNIKPLHWTWWRKILKEEAATKTAFEDIIKDGYKTVLVSTHAVYDDDGGKIVFRNSILTQEEIDLLEVNTHRLILSACETGVGKQNQGEGILSLGWNFAYKGVPSITMTHWKVNQFATKEIIVSYNENLNEGMPADRALRAAQLEYLKKYGEGNRTAPHYWAAFFHTGNTS